jgi:Zn-dependent M28 family amino/carboxypeptidase
MGSYQHSKKLYDENKSVKLMISLEMIGYYSDEKKSQDYPVDIMKLKYPSKGNYIAVVSKNGMGKHVKQVKKALKKYANIPVESLTGPTAIPGVDFSDHKNFWIFNFPALMITDTAFLRNKNYHQKTDTPEKLNYHKMAEVVKGVYYFCINA